MPIREIEKCAQNYINANSIPKVTRETICAGLSGKDSCFVSQLIYILIQILVYLFVCLAVRSHTIP